MGRMKTVPSTYASHQFPFFLRRSRNENSHEIRGYSSGYMTVPLVEMGAEGLEPPTPSV